MKYVVQKGDSLSAIARRLNVNMRSLAAFNKIKDVNKIFIGQEIKVPEQPVVNRAAEQAAQVMKQQPKRRGRMNPRQRAMQNKSTAPVESKGLMARSQQMEKGSPSLLSQTPTKVFLTSLVSSPVLGKDFFKDSEYNALVDISKDQLKKGKKGISYSTYNTEAGSKIGYGMDIPDLEDPREALKFTLGKTDFVRDGDRVLAADEFDFTGEEKIKEKSMLDQVKFLADRTGQFLSGDISLYGFGHSVGEVFSPPGQGPSFRVDLGSAEDLGIDQKQFNSLPTLEDYTQRNKSRIKQRPFRDLLQSLGVI